MAHSRSRSFRLGRVVGSLRRYDLGEGQVLELILRSLQTGQTDRAPISRCFFGDHHLTMSMTFFLQETEWLHPAKVARLVAVFRMVNSVIGPHRYPLPQLLDDVHQELYRPIVARLSMTNKVLMKVLSMLTAEYTEKGYDQKRLPNSGHTPCIFDAEETCKQVQTPDTSLSALGQHLYDSSAGMLF